MNRASPASPAIERNFDHVSTGRSRGAVKAVLWAMFSSVAPGLVSAVVFLATSRALGPSDFGVVAFAASIVALAGAVAPSGFGQALMQRKTVTRYHMDVVFWLCTGWSIFLYLGLLVAAQPLSSYFDTPMLSALIPVLGVKIIFDMLTIVPNAILMRSMSFDKLALRTVLASIMGAVVCLTLLFSGYGLWALAVSQLVASFAVFAGSLATAQWLPRMTFQLPALRDLTRFGGFATATNFIVGLNVDQLMIGSLIGPYALGIYGFSRRIFQLMSDIMAGPLNAVSFSLLSSMQGEQEKRRRAFLLASFLAALVSFPAFVGLAAISQDLVPLLFGDHWFEAIPVLQAFCAIGLLSSIGVLQSSLINSHGDADVWLYYMIGKQVVTVLYIFLFYRYGVAELTNAICIQNYLMIIPSIYMVAKILEMKILRYLSTFLVPAAASFAMFMAVEALRAYLPEVSPLARVLGSIAIGAATYGLSVCFLAHKQLLAIWSIVAKRGEMA